MEPQRSQGPLNLFHSWQTAGLFVCAMFVFTLLLTDFFDSMGTMVAVGQEAGLVTKEGSVPRAKEILFVDSLAAAAGGAASTSSNTRPDLVLVDQADPGQGA